MKMLPEVQSLDSNCGISNHFSTERLKAQTEPGKSRKTKNKNKKYIRARVKS